MLPIPIWSPMTEMDYPAWSCSAAGVKLTLLLLLFVSLFIIDFRPTLSFPGYDVLPFDGAAYITAPASTCMPSVLSYAGGTKAKLSDML